MKATVATSKPQPAADPAFAEGDDLSYADQDGLDAALEQLAARTLPGVSAALLQPVLADLRAGTDAQTALAHLSELLPQMDAALLQSTLAQLMFVADVVGRLSVQTELKA
ncbi:hypothetical protein FQZ97_1057980 [compost metagenome]